MSSPMKAVVTSFGTSLHQALTRATHLLSQLLFLFWTAFLTYRNGPYYTLLELCRNYQLFGYRKLTYEQEFKTPLEGRTCVITGGTRGIGLEVVRFLFSKGATIVTGTSTLPADASPDSIAQYKATLLRQILQVSGLEKGTATFLDATSAEYARYAQRLIVFPLDLTSMSSVVSFADQISSVVTQIDYLICNGGVMFVPFRLTRDKFECHMSINYLSHCLLILKLLPLLAQRPSPSPSTSANNNKSTKSRIVIVSSGAHHASLGLRLHDLHSTSLYSVYHGYAQSKLSLVMFTYCLDRWLTAQMTTTLRPYITVNCLHPGVCRTGLMERFNFFKLKFIQETPLFRSASEGAETILYATLSESEADTSGAYFENCSTTRSSALSYNQTLQEQLWSKTWQELRPWLTADELAQLSLTTNATTNATTTD